MAAASALAKGGGQTRAGRFKFVRPYDQLSQDLALNNSPATLLVYWGSISGADATHLGCFDISLIGNIPNIVYPAPTSKQEYLAMLDWSVEQQKYPVVIRVPFGPLAESDRPVPQDYSELNRYEVVSKGGEVAIIGGQFLSPGQTGKRRTQRTLGINATLINPRYLSGLDEELLESLKKDHRLIITLEDGVVNGGFGEEIALFYGGSDMKVLNFGAKKEFTDRVPLDELYRRFHLTKEQIAQDAAACLKEAK